MKKIQFLCNTSGLYSFQGHAYHRGLLRQKSMGKKIISLIVLFSMCSLVFAQKKNQATPNIVLIFMDDLGYGDLNSYGALGYETPNLDALANQGLRFTNFLVPQAVCSASRAALLTGSYPNRIGFFGALSPRSEIGINEDEETIGELLQKKGYATGMVGKWHLGYQEEFLPHNHGFDSYIGIPYSNDMWPVGRDGKPRHNPKKPVPPLPVLQSAKGSNQVDTAMIVHSLKEQDQLTRLFTEEAVSFIQKNKKNPFFLYLAHPMPHVPLGVSEKFRGKSKLGLFGDMMAEVDWSVGEIMKTLKSLKLEDNTILIFTSDNGPWLNFGDHAGNTGGLREGKGVSFEGGVRVPCIIRWPGKIVPGAVTNKLSSTIDILPTISKLTGAPLPKLPIDGVDITSILFGKDENPRTEFYYYYNRNDLEAVRKENWKLVFPHRHRSYEDVLPRNGGLGGPYKQGEVKELSLYDLRRDPGERYNVIEMYPEVVKELQKIAEKAREDLGDNLTKNPGKNRRSIGTSR